MLVGFFRIRTHAIFLSNLLLITTWSSFFSLKTILLNENKTFPEQKREVPFIEGLICVRHCTKCKDGKDTNIVEIQYLQEIYSLLGKRDTVNM